MYWLARLPPCPSRTRYTPTSVLNPFPSPALAESLSPRKVSRASGVGAGIGGGQEEGGEGTGEEEGAWRERDDVEEEVVRLEAGAGNAHAATSPKRMGAPPEEWPWRVKGREGGRAGGWEAWRSSPGSLLSTTAVEWDRNKAGREGGQDGGVGAARL